MFQDQFAARMPFLTRFEFDLKKEATVRVADRHINAWNPVGHGAMKILVIVGRAQPALLLLPLGEHSATLDQPFGFHLEEIGEIGAERQLHGETNLSAGVVGDVKVFVNALLHRALKRQANRIGLKIAVFRADLGVREIETCGVETELTGIDQHPGFPVDEETVVTDETRVDRVDPLVATWVDLAMCISDHEGPPLADGDARWRDFDLDRHRCLLPSRASFWSPSMEASACHLIPLINLLLNHEEFCSIGYIWSCTRSVLFSHTS